MRNLNGYEIGGRNLRVDNACTEKSRMEMQNLLNQPPVENPYGEPIQAEKAPEAISKAVASLPPEQMFELMKQMKLCVQVCYYVYSHTIHCNVFVCRTTQPKLVRCYYRILSLHMHYFKHKW